MHRIRVEHMERQLANLTGLVQKALTQNVPGERPGVPSGGGGGGGGNTAGINPNYLAVTGQYRAGNYSIFLLRVLSSAHYRAAH